MSRYLHGVVTQSLQGGSPMQRPIFNCAIECTRALLELYMYAGYKSHDDASLSYIVTWEESTPRYTQLEVSLLSIPLSCLAIRLDIRLILGLIAGSLLTFTQAQKVIRIE